MLTQKVIAFGLTQRYISKKSHKLESTAMVGKISCFTFALFEKYTIQTLTVFAENWKLILLLFFGKSVGKNLQKYSVPIIAGRESAAVQNSYHQFRQTYRTLGAIGPVQTGSPSVHLHEWRTSHFVVFSRVLATLQPAKLVGLSVGGR